MERSIRSTLSSARRVMETALRNDIASIVAECGGGCTCAHLALRSC